MEGVALVIVLALVEYAVFLWLCGRARGRFDIPAPATTGNAAFERAFRVQMNTIEHLVVFVPMMLVFGQYVSARGAIGIGLVFILGRALYARGYYVDPSKRGPGFLLTILSNAILLLGGLGGLIAALL